MARLAKDMDALKLGWSRTLHQNLVFPRRIATLGNRLAKTIPPGNVLDVGCGDGAIAAFIRECRSDIVIHGVDVLLRPQSLIPVQQFDGIRLPFGDNCFDTVLFVDVLHHTNDPGVLLKEAVRVARTRVVIKDHCMDGFLAQQTLRFMDWVGNAHHGVALPYNYWPERRWRDEFASLSLRTETWISRLGLYPWPFSLVFERELHFIAVLSAGT